MSKEIKNKLRRKVHQLKVKTVRPDHLSSKIGIGTPTLPKTIDEDISTIAFSKKIGGQYSQFYKLQKSLVQVREESFYNVESLSLLPISREKDVFRVSLVNSSATASTKIEDNPQDNPEDFKIPWEDIDVELWKFTDLLSIERTFYAVVEFYYIDPQAVISFERGWLNNNEFILTGEQLAEIPLNTIKSFKNSLTVEKLSEGVYKFVNISDEYMTLQIFNREGSTHLSRGPGGEKVSSDYFPELSGFRSELIFIYLDENIQ